MSEPADPQRLDLADFDAVGIAGDIVATVRRRAIERSGDVAARISAPPGWHRLVVTGRPSGHTVLSVRYDRLGPSRLHNVAEALDGRGWQPDEDGEGATLRHPPGTEVTVVAFEVLAVLTSAGAPRDVRDVTW